MINNKTEDFMAKEKGTAKTGGRQIGTPNKITSTIRNWLVELINNNRNILEADLLKLEPKDRLAMIEKLLPYILPKVMNADEVEGAAFSKDDYKDTDGWGEELYEKKQLQKWYKKEADEQ